MTPFSNGQPNTYARGLRVKMHRGVRTIGHDGLWPGYKTSFVRIPDHDAAVICISNDATSDPHDLAFQVVDALIEGKPGVHADSADAARGRLLPGRYLNRDTGATVDVAIDEAGRVTACTHGVAFTTIPTGDGRLATSRGSADFTMRLALRTCWMWNAMRACTRHCIVFPAMPSCLPTCRAAITTRTWRRPGRSAQAETG